MKNFLNLERPLLLAPMAGAADFKMAVAVANAGGLGSIACAMLSEEEIRNEVKSFRDIVPHKPLNLNFFCHEVVPYTEEDKSIWKEALSPYYEEFGLDPSQEVKTQERRSFDDSLCFLMEEICPEVISFHFGLPPKNLIKRLKDLKTTIISSATTLEEALWLEKNGCDVIIAQGTEAGGHRGMFLTQDISTQRELSSLLEQMIGRVSLPIVAAGGISNREGVLKAMKLGAKAVQVGTAYLFTHEAKISSLHREALLSKQGEETAITNLFTGKPARSIVNRLMRELGPMSLLTPPFPYAADALAPLKSAAIAKGSSDFMSLWSGQGARLRHEIISAYDLTLELIP